RDLIVTGVQTCALPICRRRERWSDLAAFRVSFHIPPAPTSAPKRVWRFECSGVSCFSFYPEDRKMHYNLASRRRRPKRRGGGKRSEEHTSELQSRSELV